MLVKLPTDPSGDEPLFHISHIDRVYTLRAESINERLQTQTRHKSYLQPVVFLGSGRYSLHLFFCRTAWVQKIKAASELFIETEKKKREKAYLGTSAFLSSV